MKGLQVYTYKVFVKVGNETFEIDPEIIIEWR